MQVRDLTSTELGLFAKIVGRLQSPAETDAVRGSILGDLVTLLRADGGASYVWQADRKQFGGSRYVGMAPEIPALYDNWFQFRDPMTFLLWKRR